VSEPPFDPRPFIARAGWRLSKTTEDWPDWRHYYCVEAIEDDPDFRRFIELIEAEGYVARFEGIKYRYLRVDDWLYWPSRSLWTRGQNLNRRPGLTLRAAPSTSRPRSRSDALAEGTRDVWGTTRARVSPLRAPREDAIADGSWQADDGIRTHDPWLGKPMLYQLSYVRVPRILPPPRDRPPRG
jgi:hypothetical protein